MTEAKITTTLDLTKPLQMVGGAKVAIRSRTATTVTVRITEGTASSTLNRADYGPGANFVYKLSGRHAFGSMPDLQNVPAISKVDPNKPVELDDGSAATILTTMQHGGRPCADVRIASSYRRAGGNSDGGAWNYWLDTGEWCGGEGQSTYKLLRNVAPTPAGTLDTAKPLQTRSGTPVKLEGVLSDGRLVVLIQYAGWGVDPETKIVSASGRVGGGGLLIERADDIVNKPPVQRVEYRNVYADGTVGSTAHASVENGEERCRYGLTYIGALKRTYADDVLTEARIIPRPAKKRTRAHPAGQPNAWA